MAIKTPLITILGSLFLISCSSVRLHPSNITQKQVDKIFALENPHETEVLNILNNTQPPFEYTKKKSLRIYAYPVDYKAGDSFYCRNLGLALDKNGWIIGKQYVDARGAKERCNSYARQAQQNKFNSMNIWGGVASGLNSYSEGRNQTSQSPIQQSRPKNIQCNSYDYGDGNIKTNCSDH